jgi:septum formation protein
LTENSILPRLPKIYLASASPRRAELLRQVDIEFEVIVADIDESLNRGEGATEFVKRMAMEKGQKAKTLLAKSGRVMRPVLSADTVVVLEQHILGKPVDREDAARMLRQLSGHTHEVFTAISLWDGDQVQNRLSCSRVRFAALSDEQIAWYCDTTEPLDKAGAYAIQGKAALFIENLQGSYSGVMGLPLFETGQLLASLK